MSADRTFDVDPELAYQLVLAALDVVSSVSPRVHRRIETAYDKGEASANPLVNARSLLQLRRALNELPPGGMADRVIGIS